MPAFVYNAETEKEATIKKLHEDWDDLKKTHAVVISTNKISFNRNLGKVLDNRVALWQKVHTLKDGLQTTLRDTDIEDKKKKEQLTAYRAKLNALKANAKAGLPIVAAYFTAVRKLNTTATKHAYTPLEAQLMRIDKALKYDGLYADNM